jgi:hypothetical protein
MIQLNLRRVLLALFIAAASSDRYQVCSLAVSRRSASAVSFAGPVTTLTQLSPFITKSSRVKTFVKVNDTDIISSGSPTIATKHLPKRADADGADAVRTDVSDREWISFIVSNVVTPLLGLASIAVPIFFGRRQLQVSGLQLQAMFGANNQRPHANNLEMDDLANERAVDHRLHSIDRMQVRPEIAGVDPAQRADPSNDLISDDPLPEAVRTHDVNSQTGRIADGEHIPHDGSEQLGDGSQPLDDMTAAGSCIQLGRQDCKSLDLHDRESNLSMIVCTTSTYLLLSGRRSV